MKSKAMFVSLALGLGLALATTCLLGGGTHEVTLAQSGSGVIRVAPTGSDGPGCGSAASPCRTVQFAVDQALPGEEIRLAEGVYSGVQNIPSLNTGTFTATQVVYINKSVTIRGGYATGRWATPDPEANPTTLDAQGQGRVVVVTDTTGVTLEGLRITGGDAEGLGGGPNGYNAGGGVYASHALSLTVTGCDVYSSSATTVERCCGEGGGLYLRSSDYTMVEGNTIHHNWGHQDGVGDGGGLFLDRSDHIIVQHNAIHDNVATTVNGRGGGLYVTDCDYAVLDGNVIRGNSASTGADAWAGGILLEFANHARVTNNLIKDNVASHWTWGYGGGMVLYGGINVTLENNVFVGNATSPNPDSTGFGGGGLYVEWSDATFVNTVLADNRASAHGSGVYVSNSSPRFLHTTIARNGGDGGGMYVDSWGNNSSSVALTNTVLYSHTVGITVTQGNTATLTATLWQGNGADRGGAGVMSHSDDHSGDPAFAGDGYHLRSASAAVDKGVEAGVTSDVDGDPRPTGPLPDLGADEFWYRNYLPLASRGHAPSQ
jgi:hypothetical protein